MNPQPPAPPEHIESHRSSESSEQRITRRGPLPLMIWPMLCFDPKSQPCRSRVALVRDPSEYTLHYTQYRPPRIGPPSQKGVTVTSDTVGVEASSQATFRLASTLTGRAFSRLGLGLLRQGSWWESERKPSSSLFRHGNEPGTMLVQTLS